VTPAAFTITGGTGATTVSGATATGSSVTLTTSTLAPGTTYTVTVGAAVTDPSGTPVSATMNTATFMLAAACTPATHLVISEIDYDMVGTDNAEFIEIHNPTGAPIALDGHSIILFNGSGAAGLEYAEVALSGSLAAGGYAIVAAAAFVVPTGVTLFPIAVGVQNGDPDGVALVDRRGAVPVIVDGLAYDGTMATFTLDEAVDIPLANTESTSLGDSNDIAGALSRIPTSCDRNTPAVDWQFTSTLTPGAANVLTP